MKYYNKTVYNIDDQVWNHSNSVIVMLLLCYIFTLFQSTGKNNLKFRCMIDYVLMVSLGDTWMTWLNSLWCCFTFYFEKQVKTLRQLHLSTLPPCSDKTSPPILSRPITLLHSCINAPCSDTLTMIKPWPSCGSSLASPSQAPLMVRLKPKRKAC